jgi:hypothetical protein
MTTNKFIDPAVAEDRNVFCGWCGEPVKGHLPGCPHCHKPFYANMHGYARICKNPTCRRTETAGHAHGLCRMHHLARKQRQAIGATLPKCACGNTATSGHDDCSRCRDLKLAAEFKPSDPWCRLHGCGQ